MQLDYDVDSDVNAGIIGIAQEIFAVYVININVVRVVPAHRPRLIKSEPETAVLEARISVHYSRTADAELVLTAKIGLKARVWNPTVASCAKPQRRH